jgi:cell wall assembly regulator SMI1
MTTQHLQRNLKTLPKNVQLPAKKCRKRGRFKKVQSHPVSTFRGEFHVWFSSKWLPVASDECGDEVYVDMNPAKDGTVGQVIDFYRDKGPCDVLAINFNQWLTQAARLLEAGKHQFNVKTHAIEKKPK